MFNTSSNSSWLTWLLVEGYPPDMIPTSHPYSCPSVGFAQRQACRLLDKQVSLPWFLWLQENVTQALWPVYLPSISHFSSVCELCECVWGCVRESVCAWVCVLWWMQSSLLSGIVLLKTIIRLFRPNRLVIDFRARTVLSYGPFSYGPFAPCLRPFNTVPRGRGRSSREKPSCCLFTSCLSPP